MLFKIPALPVISAHWSDTRLPVLSDSDVISFTALITPVISRISNTYRTLKHQLRQNRQRAIKAHIDSILP